MESKRHPNPAHIDAALAGSAVAPGFESLSTWAAEIRGQSATEIPLDVAAAHIAMVAETAAGANPGGAGYTALNPSRVERIRRRLVFGSLLSGIGAKVFAASVALATATGGVAATGSLPDAVQDPVASVYNSIGFDFPTSHDDDDCVADSDCEEDADTDSEEAPTSTSGNNSDEGESKNDLDDSDGAGDDSDDDDDTDGDNDDSDDDDDADTDDSDDDDDSDDKPDNPNKGKGNNNRGGGGNDGDPGDDDDGNDDDDQGDDDQGDQDGGDEQ